MKLWQMHFKMKWPIVCIHSILPVRKCYLAKEGSQENCVQFPLHLNLPSWASTPACNALHLDQLQKHLLSDSSFIVKLKYIIGATTKLKIFQLFFTWTSRSRQKTNIFLISELFLSNCPVCCSGWEVVTKWRFSLTSSLMKPLLITFLEWFVGYLALRQHLLWMWRAVCASSYERQINYLCRHFTGDWL